jgi:fucose 4-O-acetylase-like acetyltransferase
MTTPSRNPQVDAIKGSLIILVVFGHVVDIFSAEYNLYRALDGAITSFHMPLFVFLVGMFSRPALGDKDYRTIFSQFVLPLLVFQAAYLLPLRLATGKWLAPATEPYFHLWFLLAIIMMKLSLPVVVRMPFALPVSVCFALAAGYDPGLGLSFALSRTIYCFPFFLLGHSHGSRLLALATKHRYLAGAVFVCVMAVVVPWSLHGLEPNALIGSKGYAERPVIAATPAIGRALALLLAVLGSLGFIAWVPTRMASLAWLGQRTLAVYLLHGYVILALIRTVGRMPEVLAVRLLPVWMLGAVALAFGLARLDAPFKRAFSSMGEALMALGFRDSARPADQRRATQTGLDDHAVKRRDGQYVGPPQQVMTVHDRRDGQ